MLRFRNFSNGPSLRSEVGRQTSACWGAAAQKAEMEKWWPIIKELGIKGE